jgi:hypothetical protein
MAGRVGTQPSQPESRDELFFGRNRSAFGLHSGMRGLIWVNSRRSTASQSRHAQPAFARLRRGKKNKQSFFSEKG